jgi:hypothetical protein
MSYNPALKRIPVFKLLATGVIASLLSVQHLPFGFPVKQEVVQLAVSNSPTDDTAKPAIAPAIVLAGVAVGGIVIGTALNSGKNQDNTKISSARSNWSHSSQNQVVTKNIDQVRGKLQKKLLTLLHNDRNAANRLLAQAQVKYPNKTIDWYAEKVIYDLERDRH